MTLEELTAAQEVTPKTDEGNTKGIRVDRVLTGPGQGGLGLQVVVASLTGDPSNEAIRRLHSKRLGKKIFPLVVAAADGRGSVFVMGPSPDTSPIGPIPEGQAARILQAGLDSPSGLIGRQRISQLLRSFESTEVAGMTNSGLFATHYLTEGVRDTPQWSVATSDAADWLTLRGERLISAMGYSARRAAPAAHVLTDGDSNRPRAIAVLLADTESFDAESSRFAVSPVSFGLNLAQREGTNWLMVLRGSQIRIYPAKPGVGVGSRGLAETFFEIDLALLPEEDAGFLGFVFGAKALGDEGTIQLLLEGSRRYATGLGERLRHRVYEEVVPNLAVAVASQLDDDGEEVDLDLAYRLTLRILFRLLFQAYAEDRGLLPYGRNDRYTRNSLKRWAADFVEQPELVDQLDSESHAIWDDLQQVWAVIDSGDRTWDVPPYNGGLFGADPMLHPEGHLIAEMELDSAVIGYALRHLLVDITPDGNIGPVDFRSLSVREFGTIYEGLLESSLSRTDIDLKLDAKKTFVPAKKDDEVKVHAGEIYFHNSSGERKATGSYFTPSFAVEHLLERALEPAFEAHLAEVAELLEEGDGAGAEEKFFDFRVADLAMGSGHFLVAGIDTIEAGMSAFLADHPLPGVTNELRRLEKSARDALGDDQADYEFEPSALLRRQIARRCIYGLDINSIAVELARVGIWIHTFVPGLPMSTLDHNLVCANSLTGIGTVDEALDALEPDRKPGQPSMITMEIERELDEAKQILLDVANTSEATKAEVQAAAEAHRKARDRARSVEQIFNAAVAARTGMLGDLKRMPIDEIREMADRPVTQGEVAALQPGHMPYLFPEVFLRERPGFDSLVGNPPWEKLKVEEHAWWAVRYPGLRGLPQKDKNAKLERLKQERPDLVEALAKEVKTVDHMRAILATGPYPGIGKSDIDLFQAFSWRNWQLLRRMGHAGLFLPRGAYAGSGTRLWRREVLESGAFADVTFLVNNRGWIFPSVHMSYTVALGVLRKGDPGVLLFRGPFASRTEYQDGMSDGLEISAVEFDRWSDSSSFPLLPDHRSGEIFVRMASVGRFDEAFEGRLVPHRELDMSKDKDLFDFDVESSGLDVPVLTGGSIHQWDPGFGPPYALTDRLRVTERLAEKAEYQKRRRGSPFAALNASGVFELPMRSARVGYRRTVRATDTHTAIAALLPPGVVCTEQLPYFVRLPGASADDEAFLLGVFNSLPFDWYARRWVELNFSFEILAAMPVPRARDQSIPHRQRIVELAAHISACDERFEAWAEELDVSFAPLLDVERDRAIAEIDALVSHLYGLSWDQVEHIFETFHRGWDYRERLEAVRGHYYNWADS